MWTQPDRDKVSPCHAPVTRERIHAPTSSATTETVAAPLLFHVHTPKFIVVPLLHVSRHDSPPATVRHSLRASEIPTPSSTQSAGCNSGVHEDEGIRQRRKEGRRRRGREKAPGGKGGEEATVPWRRSGGAKEGRGGNDSAQGRDRDEDVIPSPRRRLEFTAPRSLHPNPPVRCRRLLLRAGRASIAASSLTTATPPPPPPPASHLLTAICLTRATEANGREN